MVYGSYSGGIFILKMDKATGKPLPGQGYGKKLLGGNHSRIEGPYILYHPETQATITCTFPSAAWMPTAAIISAWRAPSGRTVRITMPRAMP